MIFEKKNIEDNLIAFVASDQFVNFKLIVEDAALNKFNEIQKNKHTYDEMLCNKSLLNFYMSFADVLESKVKSIERRKQAEATERISKAQEEI